MEKVSAGDFQRNIGIYQDIALVKPIAITKHGNERLVLISFLEYKKLYDYARKAIKTSEISGDDLSAIENAGVPSEFDYLDKELD